MRSIDSEHHGPPDSIYQHACADCGVIGCHDDAHEEWSDRCAYCASDRQFETDLNYLCEEFCAESITRVRRSDTCRCDICWIRPASCDYVFRAEEYTEHRSLCDGCARDASQALDLRITEVGGDA